MDQEIEIILNKCYGLLSNREYKKAEFFLVEPLKKYPESVQILGLAGLTFRFANKLDKSEQLFIKALRIDEKNIANNFNYAGLLISLKRYPEALPLMEIVINADSNNEEYLSRYGSILKSLGMKKDALNVLLKAYSLNNKNPRLNMMLSEVLLSLGDFKNGWNLYEYRFATYQYKHIGIQDPKKRWNGVANISGNEILILCEQGLGDSIHFLRYVQILKQKYIKLKVSIACKFSLCSLFEKLDLFQNVFEISLVSKFKEKFNLWIPLMSLPIYLEGNPLKDNVVFPYINFPGEFSLKRKNKNLTIGIAWKGNPNHTNDVRRSIKSLNDLREILEIKNINFISLQYGEKIPQKLNGLIRNEVPENSDFLDTAKIISQVDIVISVDTSIAHLAGAMNKNCLVLIPKINQDWRWISNKGNSIWYPNSKLFFQKKDMSWKKELLEIKNYLEVLV